jgi:hypothetical protein
MNFSNPLEAAGVPVPDLTAPKVIVATVFPTLITVAPAYPALVFFDDK